MNKQTKKKVGTPAAMAPGYSRVIPLGEHCAYVSTADGRTLHVKVGSIAFYTAIATLVGCPAQSTTAAHCATLADADQVTAAAWTNAFQMLTVDADGKPLTTLDALLAASIDAVEDATDVATESV